MKRVWTALAALCLLVLGLPVSAAQSPGVTYWTDGDNVRLALEGVEEKISGLQLELTWEGRCPDAVFTPAPADAYSPPCRVELDGNTTRITLYLAAEEGLLEGKNLFLGTLSPRGSCSLPSRGELLLLDRSLEPVAGSAQRVQMTQGSGPAPQPSGERWQIRMARMEHGTVTARPSPAAAGDGLTGYRISAGAHHGPGYAGTGTPDQQEQRNPRHLCDAQSGCRGIRGVYGR